jgi:hypothetical protein
MRYDRILKLSLPLAMLGALVAVGGADDAAATPKNAVALPAPVTAGVVRDDHFFAVADGRILDVDLKQKKAKTCDGPDAKLLPFIDVADGKACVASQGKLFVVDLASGKTLHSAEFSGAVRGLGFLDADRVFAIDGFTVKVVDVTAGKTVQTIEIAKENPEGRKRSQGAAGIMGFQRVGTRLYVIDNSGYYSSRVSVVDLDNGKVLDQMNYSFWCSGLQVVGDRVYLRGVNLSYGINAPTFEFIDLKTKKTTALKDGAVRERVPDEKLDQETVCCAADGSIALAWGDSVLQYDSDAKFLGKTQVKDCGRLLGVWNDQALTAGKESLVLTPLSRTVGKAD